MDNDTWLANVKAAIHAMLAPLAFLNWGHTTAASMPFLSDKCLTPLIALLVEALVVKTSIQELPYLVYLERARSS